MSENNFEVFQLRCPESARLVAIVALRQNRLSVRSMHATNRIRYCALRREGVARNVIHSVWKKAKCLGESRNTELRTLRRRKVRELSLGSSSFRPSLPPSGAAYSNLAERIDALGALEPPHLTSPVCSPLSLLQKHRYVNSST